MRLALERLHARLLTNYAFVLVALVVVCYLPVLGAGFVWDDDENILESPNLKNLAGLARIWSDPHSVQQYYPLTHTTFWLQAQTTGLTPLAFHVVNVALHAITAVLVLYVLRRLAVAGAELGATLFALHPLNVESVAWVTERKNVLSGALALAACLLYLHFDDATSTADARRKRRLWAFALACFALALMAKTAVAPLPAALLVVLVGLHHRRLVPAAVPLMPFFACGIFAGLGTAYLERTHVHAQGSDFAWSFAERLLIAGRAFCFYPQKLLIPEGLMFFYPTWSIDTHSLLSWCFPLLALGVLSLLVVTRKRIGDAPLVAFVGYGLLIFPALGFFNVYFMRFAFVQNHFQYLAGIPVLAALAAFIARVSLPLRVGLAVVLSVLCGACSFSESRTFTSYESLFLTALERNPDAWVAAYNLGIHYQDEGNRAGAVEMYRTARRVRPSDAGIAMNLGIALAEVGRLPEALTELQAAVRLDPQHPEARLNLAMAYERAGKPGEAAAAYREALRLRPKYTRAKRQAAWLLATTTDAGVRDGQAALALATAACAETVKAQARCQDTFAAAEAAIGNFDGATQRATHAAELARREGHEPDAKTYEARARLYAMHQSFSESR